MHTLAIVPARSGSKGVADKNVRLIGSKHLIGYAIEFALGLRNVSQVICSTDSEHYARIARSYGAEVPFLRSAEASSDTAMEQDILRELHHGFAHHGMRSPDTIVWLRPTFPFRSISAVERCIERLEADSSLTACRVVVEWDPRLYVEDDDLLVPVFDDGGKSMVRRQDMSAAYRSYNTDVFRFPVTEPHDAFLGDRVGFEVAPKICGLDIDDETDLRMANLLVENAPDLVADYLPPAGARRRSSVG